MDTLATILDHYDDGGLLLRKVFSERGVPPIIKTAADMSSPVNPQDDDYAVVANTEFGTERRYPCVDAGNTLASAVYFTEHGDKLPDELRKEAAQKISDALTGFGLTPPEDLTKTAAMELGYSGAADDMSLEKLFGVEEDNTIEMISGAFDDCSPRGKRRMMLQVKEAGVQDIPEDMADYGRASVGSDLKMALDVRRLCVLDADATEELRGIFEKSAGADPEALAEEISNFDVNHKLTHLYGKVVPDPYASVFGMSIHKTASVVHPVEIDGKEYTREDISGFSEDSGDSVKEAFGDDFAEQFRADPVGVLGSLPVTHKQAIARMIDER